MATEFGRVASDRAGHERSQSSLSSPSGDHPSRWSAAIDNRRYEAGWLDANERIRNHPNAANSIASHYGRDWKTGRRTAVCAASMNTPLWQEAVARAYPRQADLLSRSEQVSHD